MGPDERHPPAWSEWAATNSGPSCWAATARRPAQPGLAGTGSSSRTSGPFPAAGDLLRHLHSTVWPWCWRRRVPLMNSPRSSACSTRTTPSTPRPPPTTSRNRNRPGCVRGGHAGGRRRPGPGVGRGRHYLGHSGGEGGGNRLHRRRDRRLQPARAQRGGSPSRVSRRQRGLGSARHQRYCRLAPVKASRPPAAGRHLPEAAR